MVESTLSVWGVRVARPRPRVDGCRMCVRVCVTCVCVRERERERERVSE